MRTQTVYPAISIYRHQDHEVRVKAEVSCYHGKGAPDDPSDADIGTVKVDQACPEIDDEGNFTGKMLYQAGDLIELTDAEVREAIEAAWEEIQLLAR